VSESREISMSLNSNFQRLFVQKGGQWKNSMTNDRHSQFLNLKVDGARFSPAAPFSYGQSV
jgi:hypothetical protein